MFLTKEEDPLEYIQVLKYTTIQKAMAFQFGSSTFYY